MVAGVLLLFAAVSLRGAPYVPTHRRTIETALDILPLKMGDTIVDLGAGDGAFLKAAANRGLKAVGLEINPILCIVAWLYCWRVRDQVTILWRDFWLTDIPPDTKAVFVFLAGPYMNKLAHKLKQQMATRSQPLWVVSHGFAIPGLTATKERAGLHVYKLSPPKH